jgi:hypothetical protein
MLRAPQSPSTRPAGRVGRNHTRRVGREQACAQGIRLLLQRKRKLHIGPAWLLVGAHIGRRRRPLWAQMAETAIDCGEVGIAQVTQVEPGHWRTPSVARMGQPLRRSRVVGQRAESRLQHRVSGAVRTKLRCWHGNSGRLPMQAKAKPAKATKLMHRRCLWTNGKTTTNH